MKHKNFETRPELLRAAADSIEMQEKAGVEPMCKNRYKYVMHCSFDDPSWYEFPLAVVEGRQVWEGDEMWKHGAKFNVCCSADICGASWNPPKPKTVMVELTVEDAEKYAEYANLKNSGFNPSALRVAQAMKKALEEMK